MKKSLVAYFSASGVTKGLADRLAKAIHADLFEIEPAALYTEADLNWKDSHSRSSVEMKDRSSRPEIRTKMTHMDQYEVVFVGFPIWWYREPSIIDTFIESYDFDGKIVIPFATSGGSGLGDSVCYIRRKRPWGFCEKSCRACSPCSYQGGPALLACCFGRRAGCLGESMVVEGIDKSEAKLPFVLSYQKGSFIF